MKYIVERIEDGIASLENMETQEIFNMDISEIPFFISEGDILIVGEDSVTNSIVERQKREAIIKEKMKQAFM